MSKLSIKEKALMPARPGYGTLGKQIIVYANYFKIVAPKELTLTRYNVEVVPEERPKKLARIFQLLLERPEFAGVATEWKSMLIAKEPLNIPSEYTLQIQYMQEEQEEPLPNATVYNVRVVAPISISISQFIHYLSATSPVPNFAHKLEAIQVLNALFGHYPQAQNGIVTTGGNRHFSTDRSERNGKNIFELGGGLESLRGYFQSIRPATGGLLLNVNPIHGVFIQPRPLNILYSALGSGNIENLKKKLFGVRFHVTHLVSKKNKKTGQDIPRIKNFADFAHPRDGRSEDHPPQIPRYGAGPREVKFWLSDAPVLTPAPAPAPAKGKGAKSRAGSAMPSNTYISVYDYFHRKYPTINLNDQNPVVNVGNRDHPSYLPAEVMVCLPGQVMKRRLSPEQTAEMIKFACRAPWENAESIITDGKSVLGLNPSDKTIHGKFGLTVGQGLITVNARVLQPPQIKYKNYQQKDQSVTPNFGSWNMANIKFHTGSNLGNWTWVRFRSSRRSPDGGFQDDAIAATVRKFREFLMKAGVNAGALIEPPPPAVYLVEGQTQQNNDKVKEIIRRIHQNQKSPRFVLCILPFPDVALYNSIKTFSDTKAGFHTVCVVSNKFMKELRQDQYFGNVSLKFNLKAGGINQTLDAPKLGVISEGKTMVVGIDVTHPQPGAKETAPSVAGIVASVDKFLGQWPSTFSIQERRKEMVSALEGMFMSRLALWEKRNKQLPENIVIYRDGVSEGQYDLVLNNELPLIRNACRQKYPATQTKAGLPRISIIICGKRHNTRFYPTSEQTADRSSNCQPGTIVDRGVTEVRNWDFFLQPHACLQGTARSGHYVVILDEIFRGRPVKAPHSSAADTLEDLTMNMCHLFGRATKAVSLCPPAYYADLLCTRVRCYLSDQYDPNDSSATASVISGGTPAPPPTFDVTIPPTLADSMYYI
jgi:hypothetical protein